VDGEVRNEREEGASDITADQGDEIEEGKNSTCNHP